MHCQSEILYEYLASAEGLAEWFADDVVEKGDDFYFSWNGGEPEKATMIRYKPESFVRYRWEADEGTKNFFELTIVIDEITNDLSLNVTDFADEGDEEEVQNFAASGALDSKAMSDFQKLYDKNRAALDALGKFDSDVLSDDSLQIGTNE